MGYEIKMNPWFQNKNVMNELWQYNSQNPPVILVDTFMYRRDIMRWYRRVLKQKLYDRLVYDMCPNLQFNARTKAQILNFQKKLNIPDAFTDKNESTTIGFHIRRGDKLLRESRKFEAYEYIQRFEDQAGIDVVHTLKHCFVTSDDPATIQELQDAIKGNGNWSCVVHSFTETSFIGDNTYLFLTELSVLIDASYLVGTLNSNVGSLVSILHSCGSRFDKNFTADNNYFHFVQSYGADQDDWPFW